MLFATGANFAGAKVQLIWELTKFLANYFIILSIYVPFYTLFTVKSAAYKDKSSVICKIDYLSYDFQHHS